MSNSTNITYGSYNFRNQAGPIPSLTITQTFQRSDDGTQIGSKYNMTLEGVLTPLPSGGGYQTLDSMQDALMSGFSVDGQNLLVTCNAATLISEYPRVNSIRLDKSNDNWVYTTPYTIDLEWDGLTYSGLYLDSISETWNIEFNQDTTPYSWNLPGGTGDANGYILNINHSVSAKGIGHYSSGNLVSAWKSARNFVISKLGYDNEQVAQTGVLNINASLFTGYNHTRVVQVDEAGGSYSTTESWTAITNTGCGRAIEDFTASVQFSQEEGLTSVDIQGTIKGLETVNYGSSSGAYTVVETKWDAASGYWQCAKSKLLGRANFIAREFTSRGINPQPLTLSVSHAPTQGTIGYGYKFDDRATNLISGALYENITFTDNYPANVFASIPILGRAYGPILQDIGTVTETRMGVNIDIVVPVATGSVAALITSSPKSQVDSFLCQVQQQISGVNNQLFKAQDTDSWQPKIGKYQRTVEFVLGQCGGTPPSTSFCG